MWLWVVVIVAIIGVLVVVAVGRDDAMAEVYDDRPDSTIATGRPLSADDLSEVRFSTAVRGYRMDEVDAFIARVQADLLAREHYEPPLLSDSTPPADQTPASDAPRGRHVDQDAGVDHPAEEGPS